MNDNDAADQEENNNGKLLNEMQIIFSFFFQNAITVHFAVPKMLFHLEFLKYSLKFVFHTLRLEREKRK
jgi:hypothetical protein